MVTPATRERITRLFPASVEPVATLLENECGRNLPSCAEASAAALERLHAAALRVSEGDWQQLTAAVRLAQVDWRDLLMAADFGLDPDAHRNWWPEPRPC